LFFLPIRPISYPIEQVFAEMKHLLRKLAPRTIGSVVASIGDRLGLYTKSAPITLKRQDMD
jgi:hypothetical protein